MADPARVPPQNLDAEESVLGAMMLSPIAIDVVTGIVRPRDFYRDSHATIFNACLSLHNESHPVDALTVADYLEGTGDLEKIGGRPRLHELATLVPATSNVGHYAAIVRDKAIERGLTVVGEQIGRLGWDGADPPLTLLEKAEGLLYDLADRGAGADFTVLGETMDETVQHLIALYDGTAEMRGLRSGFPSIDRLTSGFQPGNLIVLAARPSMGKSALAFGIAAHVTLQEQLPVAMFNLEMSRSEIAGRLLSAEAAVESQKLRNPRHMVQGDWSKVMEKSGRLGEAPLYVDDTRTLTATEIRSKARRLKLRQPNLALVIVDYLQLMAQAVDSSRRVNEVAAISRSLKILAGELNVPVLALSQLSRNLESRHDRRPILSDLRDSGAIEQDADLVLFIYRDEVYNAEDPEVQGLAEVNLAKHRNGPTDTVKLSFVKRYARFAELPQQHHVAAPPPRAAPD